MTALGETDTAGGWRENKAAGGVLIDVTVRDGDGAGSRCPTRRAGIAAGSGCSSRAKGTPGDGGPRHAEPRDVAELPGFTRGLAFAGPLAFIGLSQVREATTFGGLPLTGRLEERQCGVWVVDIETGATSRFLRFEDLVQEIFEVCCSRACAFRRSPSRR